MYNITRWHLGFSSAKRCSSFTVSHLRASPNLTLYPADSAVYVNCDSGYKLSGFHLIQCKNGTWTPTIPECTAG